MRCPAGTRSHALLVIDVQNTYRDRPEPARLTPKKVGAIMPDALP